MHHNSHLLLLAIGGGRVEEMSEVQPIPFLILATCSLTSTAFEPHLNLLCLASEQEKQIHVKAIGSLGVNRYHATTKCGGMQLNNIRCMRLLIPIMMLTRKP